MRGAVLISAVLRPGPLQTGLRSASLTPTTRSVFRCALPQGFEGLRVVPGIHPAYAAINCAMPGTGHVYALDTVRGPH
eukprot:3481886-Rhodomonas_salina.4